MPLKMKAALTARVLLVKRMGVEMEITFKDYRKFQAESKVIEATALPEPAVRPN